MAASWRPPPARSMSVPAQHHPNRLGGRPRRGPGLGRALGLNEAPMLDLLADPPVGPTGEGQARQQRVRPLRRRLQGLAGRQGHASRGADWRGRRCGPQGLPVGAPMAGRGGSQSTADLDLSAVTEASGCAKSTIRSREPAVGSMPGPSAPSARTFRPGPSSAAGLWNWSSGCGPRPGHGYRAWWAPTQAEWLRAISA